VLNIPALIASYANLQRDSVMFEKPGTEVLSILSSSYRLMIVLVRIHSISRLTGDREEAERS